jgi:hypothetical protein
MSEFISSNPISWSDLKDSVPKLVGPSNYETWRIALYDYVFGKGVLSHLDSHPAEPYRAKKDGTWDRDGRIAAHSPPSGRAIDSAQALTLAALYATDEKDAVMALDEMYDTLVLDSVSENRWLRWARNERAARAMVLQSVDADLATDLRELASAFEIYSAITKRFHTVSLEKIANLTRNLHALRLEPGYNADKLEDFYKSLSRAYAELSRHGAPVADAQKVANTFGVLPPDVSAPLRIEWLGQPEKTWSTFTGIFYNYVNAVRATTPTSGTLNAAAGANAAPRAKAAADNNGQNKSRRGHRGKGGKPSTPSEEKGLVCRFHPGMTNHATKDCNLGQLVNEVRKMQGKQRQLQQQPKASTTRGTTNALEDNPPAGSTASFAPVDAFTGYYGSAAALVPVSVPAPLTVPAAPPLAVAAVALRRAQRKLLVDSGSTHHIVGDRSLLVEPRIINPLKIQLGGTVHHLTLTEVGALELGSSRINSVFYSPDTVDNILSMPTLAAQGWLVDMTARTIKKGPMTLRLDHSYSGGRPALSIDSQGQLASSDAAAPATPVRAPQVITPLQKIHIRLGHLGRTTLLDLVKAGLIDEITLEDARADPFDITYCGSCLKHKTARLPRPGPSPRGTSAAHEYVHADVKTMTTPSKNGFKNWLAVVADYSQWRQSIPMKDKGSATRTLKRAIAKLERQTGVKVVVIRTDNGKEFDNEELAEYCLDAGIIHQLRPPYDEALNGVAERFNRTFDEMVKTLLDHSGLAHEYWDHAAWYANTVILMTTLRPDGMTAYEFYHGRKPALDRLLPFGLRVFARVMNPSHHLPSTERPRSVAARILSCKPEIAGWLILSDNGWVTNVRDVFIFNPDGTEGGKLPEYTDEGYATTSSGPGENIAGEPVDQERVAPDHKDDDEDEQPAIAATTLAADDNDLSREYEGKLASLAAQDIYEGNVAAQQGPTTVDADPVTVEDALSSPDRDHWLAGMQKELSTLRKKETWVEATVPRGRKRISTKWVFKKKRDAQGNIATYKARLVARGFSQIKGVDFEETFSPVSRLATLRILLAHAAAHDLELRQADVEGAYLNGPLEEEVYLDIPEGYDHTVPRTTGLRLKKALYGLKQSGRAWWLELDRALVDIGFKRVPNEWGIYTRSAIAGIAYLLIYVDDLLIATRTVAEADAILASLAMRWSLIDLGSPSQMLSLKITRDRVARTITLSCENYVNFVAAKYDLASVRVGKTAPLPTTGERHLKPAEPHEALSTAQVSSYQTMVGIALWLAMTVRIDLAYSAGFLGRVSHAPTTTALVLVRRVLAHAAHTAALSLVLGGTTTKPHLHMYSDADWAADPYTSLSTSGYVAFLYGSPVSWASRRQKSVAPSTTAAEYVAASEATREVLYLRQLLEHLVIDLEALKLPTPLLLDSLSAVRIGEKPVNFPLAKHLNVRHHLVRENVHKNIIRLEHVGTAEQLADVLTKSLGGTLHSKAVAQLRLIQPRLQ